MQTDFPAKWGELHLKRLLLSIIMFSVVALPGHFVPAEAEADTTPPSVSLTSPSESRFVSRIVAVSAEASDDVSISSVEFQVDAASIGTTSVPPYETYWDTTSLVNGQYTVTAVASDNSENETADTVTVNADNGLLSYKAAVQTHLCHHLDRVGQSFPQTN